MVVGYKVEHYFETLFIDHRKADIDDNLSFFEDKVSLNVILQYTVKLPSDFNYVLENIEKINSVKVIEAMAKILYLSGQINHFIEMINCGVELNTKMQLYDFYIPIKDLERINYWLTLLQIAARNMYDGMKEIRPVHAIYTDGSIST